MEKARQTQGAGPTWIRIDESAGLFMLSRLGPSPIHEQLGYFINCLQPALQPFSHVRGIVVSFGAEPGQTLQEMTSSQLYNQRVGGAGCPRSPAAGTSATASVRGADRRRAARLAPGSDRPPTGHMVRGNRLAGLGAPTPGLPLSGSFLNQQSGGVTLNSKGP